MMKGGGGGEGGEGRRGEGGRGGAWRSSHNVAVVSVSTAMACNCSTSF